MNKHQATQIPRRISHQLRKADTSNRAFNYDLDYSKLDLSLQPHFYRVGIGEQGVLLVEPYKSKILPFWRFKTPEIAQLSAAAIYSRFNFYKNKGDFIGMDMARKFLQMGYTRSRRYANRSTGRKYDSKGNVLPFAQDLLKAESAKIFFKKWKEAESDPVYSFLKKIWKKVLG
jgi:hypothetical protein